MEKPIPGAEVEADLAFSRKEWAVQRTAWVIMAVLILAALGGVFGRGPVASAVARQGAVTMEFDRFVRHGAEDTVELHVSPDAFTPLDGRPGLVSVWLNREFVAGVELHTVAPPPQSVKGTEDRVVYSFLPADSSKPLVVSFRFRHQRYWRQSIHAGLEHEAGSLRATQIIYP